MGRRNADYMALLLNLKQSGVKSKFLKNTMRDKLKQSDQGSNNPIKAYLKSDIKLYEYDYGEEGRDVIHSIAQWYVAYLINNFGEESMIEFNKDLDSMGFENSFIKHFEKSYQNSVGDFNIFIKQSMKKILKIIP